MQRDASMLSCCAGVWTRSWRGRTSSTCTACSWLLLHRMLGVTGAFCELRCHLPETRRGGSYPRALNRKCLHLVVSQSTSSCPSAPLTHAPARHRQGGGGALKGASVAVTSCTFTACSAAAGGSVDVSAVSGNFSCTACLFRNSSAGIAGGAVNLRNPVRDCTKPALLQQEELVCAALVVASMLRRFIRIIATRLGS